MDIHASNIYVSAFNVSEDGGRGDQADSRQCDNHWRLMKQCHGLNGSEQCVTKWSSATLHHTALPATDIQDQSRADTIH